MSMSYRGPVTTALYKILIWPAEACLLFALLGILTILPVTIAAPAMSALFRLLGPVTGWHKRSYRQLSFAMPDLSEAEKSRILHGMWDNLGRTVGEYMHIRRMLKTGKIQFRGTEHLSHHDGGLIISAHLANWEALSLIGLHLNIPMGLIYRPLNNPLANRALKRRAQITGADIYEKGRDASFGMLRTLRKGGFMLMLADQQLREGISVPFFGHPAQTAISHIKLAMKQNKPIFLTHVERVDSQMIIVTIQPALTLPDTGDDDAAVADIAAQINMEIEGWIRNRPDQWLWPHRRWGKILPPQSDQTPIS